MERSWDRKRVWKVYGNNELYAKGASSRSCGESGNYVVCRIFHEIETERFVNDLEIMEYSHGPQTLPRM